MAPATEFTFLFLRDATATRSLIVVAATLLICAPALATASNHGLALDSPNSPYPHRLVSGVYKEQLPSPIFYDTFVPIVFEYQLPEWNKSEVTFNNWYTCLSETTPYKYTCPTVFHMNKAILNLHIDFESLQPVQDSRWHSSYFGALYRTSTFCDTIQKHFSGVFIGDQELETYLEMLGKCHQGLSLSLGHIERGIVDYNYTLRAPFSKMENNYYNTYYKPMNANNSGLDLVASATLSNARTTIQATLLNVFYAEKYRWVHALQDCQQQLLPHSLVTLKKLNDTLHELSSTPAFQSTYEFALTLDLLSKYYSLPLTDCTYTANSFVVRLLFPVRRISSTATSTAVPTLTMYALRPVPFQYDNKFCHVHLSTEVEQHIVHDSTRNVTYKSTCTPNSLCLTSEFMQSSQIDYCASGIVQGNFTATKDNCDFDCKDVPQGLLNELVVTRVGSDMFVVTSGRNGTKIGVNCNGQVQDVSLPQFGALQLRLPCKCQLVTGSLTQSQGAWFSEFPCDEGTTLEKTMIEPWHLHYSDSFDNESSTDPAVRQYFLVKKAIYLQQLHDPASLDHLHDDDWSGAGQADGSATSHAQQIGVDTGASGGGNASNSSSDSHVILWVFFTVSVLIVLTLQVYIIYQLRFVRLQSNDSPTLLQSMLFNVRGSGRGGADPEPEFRLLNND